MISFVPALARAPFRRNALLRGLIGTSLPALALAAGLLNPASVRAQEPPRAAFGSMLAMQRGQITLPDGTQSQWTGANRPTIGTDTDGRPLMTIEQTQARALLDWEDFRLQAGEVLEFQQQRSDWIAVNRVHGAQAAEVHGEIRAPGRVFILNDNGVLVGDDAVINTRQLVTGSGVSDVQVSGATTTIVQSGPRSILEWRGDLTLDAGEVLRIQQEKKDWIQLNRFVGGVAHLNGSIQADGHLYLVAPEGLSINGHIRAQQVLASQLNLSDYQFGLGLLAVPPVANARQIPQLSNTWQAEGGWSGLPAYVDLPAPVDANDPQRFNLTIGADARIETGSLGKILLFGNNVTNRGVIHALDGQIVMGAGEHVWLGMDQSGQVTSFVGPYAPYSVRYVDFPYLSGRFPGEPVGPAERYAHWLAYQADRIRKVGFRVTNEGEVTSEHGSIDLRGFELRQMGAMAATSTALVRGNIDFAAFMFQQDYEYPGPYLAGNGSVVFGPNSVTTILPDVLSTDAIALSAGMQSVGTIGVRARTVHMQDDALVYAPSGNFRVLLDAGGHVANFGGNRGEGANQDNEDGTRFMMEDGAVIDLSGWSDVAVPMESNTVSGRLFISQLRDSPLQRNGPLYRQLVEIDRRFGTHVADWSAFDNLTQATLPRLLIDGGKFELDVGNDFIMKQGAVIDVSGGAITYEAGFVNSTLLQTADGRIIDIRNADPDEIYLGLANQVVVQDQKWGQSTAYYIPLMSSRQGRWEESYQHGGKAGAINILAPDSVLQGTVRGEVVVGKYQRGAPPAGGVFSLNAHGGDTEGEYRNNRTLITDIEQLLGDGFTFDSSLEDVNAALFGEEIEPGEYSTANTHYDNGALLSEDFFNRSTMGSYAIRQSLYQGPQMEEGSANVVEAGVALNLANGASFSLDLSDDLLFLGSFRSQGGDFEINNIRGVVFSSDSVIDTRGGWFSDYEFLDEVPLVGVPRVHGGDVAIRAGDSFGQPFGYPSDMGLVMPEGMVINTGGGAWVNRDGHVTLGRGGDITLGSMVQPGNPLVLDADLSALGLGGNGALRMDLRWDDILISDDEAPDAEEGRRLFVIGTDFFDNAGFSAITLNGRAFTIADGVQVDASAATLTLRESFEGRSPYYAPTGTDLDLLTSLERVSPGLRPAALRDGMDLKFSSGADLDSNGLQTLINPLTMGAGSSLRVEAGGSVALTSVGLLDIGGDIVAPGGEIDLFGVAVRVRAGSELNAAGVARTLSEIRAPDGRILREGEVLAGGQIEIISGGGVVLEEGAVLDVSGASAVFDVADSLDSSGVVVRTPRTIASAGGLISIGAMELDVNDATYRAHAGGAGVRGGTFRLGFNAQLGTLPGDLPPPATVAEAIGYLNFYGLTYQDGTPVEDVFTADLSQVAFEYVFGVPFDFPPGYTLGSAEDLSGLVQQFYDAALGGLSVLMVGDNLPPPGSGGGGGPELPTPPQGLRDLILYMAGSELPEPGPAGVVAAFSPGAVADGGFSTLDLSSSSVIQFVGETRLGERDGAGAYNFDRINLGASAIIAGEDADVHLIANTINLSTQGLDGTLEALLANAGIAPVTAGTQVTLDAGSNLIVTGGEFVGFDTVNLFSRGDLSGAGLVRTPGALRLQADQVYSTLRYVEQGLSPLDGLAHLEFSSDRSIEVLAPADGPRTPAPYEAANTLTLRAPRITQGGVLRSPLGTINLIAYDDGTEGAGVLTLLAGSLTSASADGRVIPWGYTANGDTFLGPNGQELLTLPTKTVNLTGDVLDLQDDAVIDVSGSGDIFAYEFVAGVGGSHDWLTGYRDDDYNWVDDDSEVFAVVPSFDADPSQPNAGPQIYLSGGSGLPAGYYTLLPARYALLPGAFRVTARHNRGDFANMPLGTTSPLNDGSTIQAGYRLEAGTDYRDQRTDGFMVMPGETLRTRSQYVETLANTFFQSDAYLRRALRTNLPLGAPPRTPLDGGSVTLSAVRSINLDATLLSAGGEGGRGGFADINAPRIVIVAPEQMGSTEYGSDFLLLNADQLSRFGAESLLIGGVRRQGADGLVVDVSADTVIVDNAGSVLYGPEILLAASDDVRIEDGAVIEVRGKIGGSSGDLTLAPEHDRLLAPKEFEWQPDVLIHDALDQGALFRASSDGLVGILRDPAALARMNALLADPAALAAVNAQRESLGLAPLVAGGRLTVADGARITGARSVVLDATATTVLGAGATLETAQLSASASRISFGDVAPGVEGLVFAGGSLGALGRVEDLILKSYSTIDFYGPVSMTGTGSLGFDASQFRSIGGGAVSIVGDRLQLTNTSGVTASASAGSGQLTLSGREVVLGTGVTALDGFGAVVVEGRDRVVGRGTGGIVAPGDLEVRAGTLTAESGASLSLDAVGAVTLAALPTSTAKRFETLGATINITGASIRQGGVLDLAAGNVNLRAREGDVVMEGGSRIDVTGDVSTIFDRETPANAGTVGLTSDRGDVVVSAGSTIDLSGAPEGGSAGTLRVSVPLGSLELSGTILASAADGERGGSFDLDAMALTNFAGLGAILNQAGFDYSRRFKIAQGDVIVSGETAVQNFSLAANGGSVTVTGTVRTTGQDGGSIRLSAAGDLTLSSSARLVATGSAGGSGGTVILETAGVSGGAVDLVSGSLIDVSGQGAGGRTVRIRAPQIGADMAIDRLDGRIIGARSVLAEAWRGYDDVETIDQGVIDQVSADADLFMAGAGAIRARLGGLVTIVPGIELRSEGDMTLVTDWSLEGMRYGADAGVLTLRAGGDLKLDANLSDGFTDATRDGALLDGQSWSFSLTAGADLDSADSTGVLAIGLLEPGKGSLIIGGVADQIDYFMRGGSMDRALYLRDPETGAYIGGELVFDAALDAYIDPVTGEPIARDPETGQFVEAAYYGFRELPYVKSGRNNSGIPDNPAGVQIDTSDGYFVRTGTGSITAAAGRDIVFQEKASAMYTAGVQSAAIPDFDAPTRLDPQGLQPIIAYYPENGGDIVLRAQNDIVGGNSDQFPGAYLWRFGLTEGQNGAFSPGATGRAYEQTTWFIAYKNFKAGVGALGGGNITISAGGDIANLSASIPTTGRVSGNRFPGDVAGRIVTTGSGDLTVDAGGDILSGLYYVGEGEGVLTAGGAFRSGSEVRGLFGVNTGAGWTESVQPIHALLFTSGGQFRLRAGGDLNIEAVLDPLSGIGSFENANPLGTIWGFQVNARPGYSYFQTYEADAAVDLFSAGGDVKIWNNSTVVAARQLRGAYDDEDRAPLVLGVVDYGPVWGAGNNVGAMHMSNQHYLWPSNLTAVAAAGDVIVQGGFTLFPSATGNLELLAGQNVYLDLVLNLADEGWVFRDPAEYNFLAGTSTLRMSQSDPALVPNPLRVAPIGESVMQSGAVYGDSIYNNAGFIRSYESIFFSEVNPPDLHKGDFEPIRIYAGEGDIFMNRRGRGVTGTVTFPKPAWFFAGGDIYFPNFVTQHNSPADLSVYRAGGSIFFSATSTIQTFGPGRLEIEAGRDIWIPSQALGIQTGDIRVYPNQYDSIGAPLNPEERAADIGISVGYNQTPSYAAFEDAYLNPDKAGDQADYLLDDLGDGRELSVYLIDQVYDRAGGPDQEFPTETREGLVNYVRRQQGLEPLKDRDEQLAWLDQAWAAWQTFNTDRKSGFFREVLFTELRTAGREATDPDSDRYQSANRGYDAIRILYPGAEKSADEALADGESRWTGDFETYLSVVRTNGGGDIEFVAPGGAIRLANSLAGPSDPLRAGVVTLEGGEINMFAHDSVTVNESRILTAKGGNVMIWSSYGDIAAGRGARTSITPPNFIYKLAVDGVLTREPGGLPSGAGIGTLATVPGTPPADVDLVAPNGIVDAGDGGIRVSGNFNVFAVQILGTDNIEVGGVATGLPQPPAQPPNSLDVDNAASKADVSEAIADAVGQVRRNTGVETPSIIEVRVVGFGEECRDERTGQPCRPQASGRPSASNSAPSEAPRPTPVSRPVASVRQTLHFELGPQSLDQALRQLGRMSGVNLVYDSPTLPESKVVSLSGDMTMDEALGRLLEGEDVTWERTGNGTVVIRRTAPAN